MTVDFSDYTDGGGISEPRFELRNLDDDETMTTIDLTITATTPYGSNETRLIRDTATWIEETVSGGITPDGTLIQKSRGFRYHETMSTPIMSLADLANVKAILSHPYHIKYYPNKDNLYRWLYVKKTGTFDWLKQNIQLPYYQASISVVGVSTVDAIPHTGTIQKALNHAQWTLGNFSAAEEERALRALNQTQWDLGNFSASEMLRGRIPQTMGKAYKDGFVSANL